MCGIIAVLRRRSTRPAPGRQIIDTSVRAAVEVDLALDHEGLAGGLSDAAEQLEQVRDLLQGPPGVATLLEHADLSDNIDRDLHRLETRIDALEGELDRGAQSWSAADLEAVNAALIRLRDAAWSVRSDRLQTAAAVRDLAGDQRGTGAIEGWCAVQTALASLDLLEVRGRDSAGLHLLVRDHGLDPSDPEVARALASRASDPLFRGGSVRLIEDGRVVCFVYKRSAEIGELGDNVAALRTAMRGDELLHRAFAAEGATTTVLGHTRWASVGIISEANAHPLNHEEAGDELAPYVAAALNGDVDNHAQLVVEHGLELPAEITTDAKVIPVLISRRMATGDSELEAFRQTVSSFEGSVAIAASSANSPDQLNLSLRGSGQALYVGMTEDAYVVASEPYGVVQECRHYLRLDGETPGNPDNPANSRGQIVRLSRDAAGTVAGIERVSYDGTSLPVGDDEPVDAAITTRDVDRGTFPHYLLKEISEAPRSFRKTLRGRIVERDGLLRARLDTDALSDSLRQRLADGTIRRLLTIGQGTAAVAAQGVAASLELALGNSNVTIQTLPATELSGFHMRADMSDTLVVAISQSGTTTDTNRTVDLVRSRGAVVVAIVNRRGSDLTDKADGVIYTSDGRDVEMSVASTKAFYAQIAAGFLLSFALAQEVGCCDERQQHEVLAALRSLPDAMIATLDRRDSIAEAARKTTRRRYWALVGNGPNRIAAEEVRIKLSELCYKSIACDATEDKKHIDLSSEPMILVCAAGLSGSTADDVAKEVAIYQAHKALPIVIADEREERFATASSMIRVPAVHPSLAFVLSTVAGHLFGYECALAIDALALPLRETRAAIESAAQSCSESERLLASLAPELNRCSAGFHEALRDGRLDGSLEASTSAQLSSLLRYATGIAPLESFQLEHGRVGTPGLVIDELTEALTKAIEELTRPVDAIKHQAKTVTVGISRSDEALMTESLVRELLASGASRDAIGYADLRALAGLGPLVAEVVGFSYYRIDELASPPTIRQVGSGGVAANLPSRTHSNPELRGTKHQVARERRLLIATGRSDGRSVLLIPEVHDGRTVGLSLLHVEPRDRVSSADARGALEVYRNRYALLRDAVRETEPDFDDSLLASIDVMDLLTAPIHQLAEAWRGNGAPTSAV